MICFPCAYGDSADPQIGYVAFTSASVRVETSAPPRSHGHLKGSQRVTAKPPCRIPPSSSWLLYRAARRPDSASATLLAHSDIAVVGPFPPELDADDVYAMTGDMANEVFDEWAEAQVAGPGPWGGGMMGGLPNWAQADRTPSCAVDLTHGEMCQLLSYNGDDQFLDGGLHVFVCRQRGCAHLAFVAEF